MIRPKPSTAGGRRTMGMSARMVRRGLIQSMRVRVKTDMTVVFTAYITAGPAACRTARVSWVARLMMSPVRCRPKNPASSRRRCRKKSSRRSHSMRREIPFRSSRIPYRAAPPTRATPTMRSA
jgi:hypothetical protein